VVVAAYMWIAESLRFSVIEMHRYLNLSHHAAPCDDVRTVSISQLEAKSSSPDFSCAVEHLGAKVDPDGRLSPSDSSHTTRLHNLTNTS
jgi:hypothetical protein